MSNQKSTEVPGQLFGYSLQETRMLFRLLSAKAGDVVSVEVFDDVGQQSADNSRVAEQAKTALDRNPVSDRAVDLWKTFRNWLNSARLGKVDVSHTSFELYVTSQKSGSIIDAFHKAQTPAEAEAAYDVAKTALMTPTKGKPTDAQKFAAQFFADADKATACQIIQKCSLTYGSGVQSVDLLQKLESQYMPAEHKDLFINNALGWVKMEATSLLERQLPCAISYDAFHTEMTAYLEKLRRRTVLPSLSSAPTQSQLELLKKAIFVRQLRAIDSEDGEILEAMNDFFLAASDRVDYISKGWVSSSSFAELEDGLKRVWRDAKKAITLEGQNSNEKDSGQKLFLRCKSHRARVEGMEPPSYCIPGSFHQLANEPSIGWHPRYIELTKRISDE